MSYSYSIWNLSQPVFFFLLFFAPKCKFYLVWPKPLRPKHEHSLRAYREWFIHMCHLTTTKEQGVRNAHRSPEPEIIFQYPDEMGKMSVPKNPIGCTEPLCHRPYAASAFDRMSQMVMLQVASTSQRNSAYLKNHIKLFPSSKLKKYIFKLNIN